MTEKNIKNIVSEKKRISQVFPFLTIFLFFSDFSLSFLIFFFFFFQSYYRYDASNSSQSQSIMADQVNSEEQNKKKKFHKEKMKFS